VENNDYDLRKQTLFFKFQWFITQGMETDHEKANSMMSWYCLYMLCSSHTSFGLIYKKRRVVMIE